MATEDDTIGVNARDNNSAPIADEGDDPGESKSDDKSIEVDEPVQIEGNAETFNIVSQLKEEYLDEAADVVMSSFSTNWESTKDYRQKRRHLYKLFRGNLDPKSEPFEDCANIHLPVVLQAISALVPRVVTELFPTDDYIYIAVPTGPEDQSRADILTQHGEFQFKHEIVDFIPQFERVTTEALLAGTAYMYSCYDAVARHNRHEFIGCEDLVMSYTHKAVDPSLADVPEKIFIRRWSRHELENLVAEGKYDALAVEELLEPIDKKLKSAGARQARGATAKQDTPELTVQDEVDEVEGHKRPEDDPTAPYVFYEYHGWYVLPGEEMQRPVVITVDATHRKVVSFYLREDDDWRDKERYDREIQEIANYQMAMEQYAEAVRNPQMVLGPTGMPMPGPQPEPPAKPPSVKLDEQGQPEAPAPVKKIPIEYFTRFDCIYDPQGSLGIGIGDMIMGFNMMCNQLGNLFVDAASIGNNPPQLISETAIPPGPIEIFPGAIIRSPLPAEQLRNSSIKLIETTGNPQLLEVMNILMGAAKEVASTPDVYSGEPGKANETFRGLATRVEQATKPLTAIAQRLLRGVTEVVRKNARLNSIFLPEDDLINVIDPTKGKSQPVRISRSIYLEDYDITFTADTRFVSQQQKMDEDMQLMAFASQSPLFMGNPVQQKMFLYEVATRYLKHMKIPELIPYLGPRPTPPPPPQPIEPHTENALFLEGKSPPVHPLDTDNLHVQEHNMFLGSQEGGYLDPQQKKNLEQHVRNHVGAMITKAAKGDMANGPENGPGGAPGMAQPSGNPPASPGN